jgi:hypothetical protein
LHEEHDSSGPRALESLSDEVHNGGWADDSHSHSDEVTSSGGWRPDGGGGGRGELGRQELAPGEAGGEGGTARWLSNEGDGVMAASPSCSARAEAPLSSPNVRAVTNLSMAAAF